MKKEAERICLERQQEAITACFPMDFTKQQAYDFVKKQCPELRKICFSKKLIEKWGFN